MVTHASSRSILHRGKVITLDRSSRIAPVAVRSGRIAAVGDDAALLKDAAPTTRLIGLNGHAVLPGFFDAHPHADCEGLKARWGIPIAELHPTGTAADSATICAWARCRLTPEKEIAQYARSSCRSVSGGDDSSVALHRLRDHQTGRAVWACSTPAHRAIFQ